MDTRIVGFALAMICLVVPGCKHSGARLFKAGGTVTHHKQPLAGVTVVFTPESGRPATATTDSVGRFTMGTLRPNDGAVQGPHKVSIIPSSGLPRPGGNDPRRRGDPRASVKGEVLPRKYFSPETSGLSANVQADGANDFHFDLKD